MRFRLLPFILLVACAPPPVLRTALVPDAYLPSRLGAPLDEGETRIAGEAGTALGKETVYSSPQVSGMFEAPGVFIPRLHLGGSIYKNVATNGPDRVDFGGQLHYASYDWSQPNVTGVRPLPAGASKHLLWGGIGARYDHDFPSGTFVGGQLQCDLALVRESTWVYGRYQGDDSQIFLLPSLYTHIGTRLTPHFSLFALSGLQLGVRNVGFSYDVGGAGSSSLSGYLLANLDAGAEYRVGSVFANVTAAMPLTGDEFLRLAPTLTAQLGISFGGP